MNITNVPLNMITQVVNIATCSAYDPVHKKERYWKSVIYDFSNRRFKSKEMAGENEPYFERLGYYLIFYSKKDEFFAITGEATLDPIMVLSKNKELFRLGDLLFNGQVITNLKLLNNDLFINGESFTSLQKKLKKINK